MNRKIKILAVFLAAFFVFLGGVFYFLHQVDFSHGSYRETKNFKIEKGQGNGEIASRLKNEKLISQKIYFYYYLRSHGLLNKILPGDYKLSGSMAIPEIAKIITVEQERSVKVTFPEGFTIKEMAQRLNQNNLPGNDFLKIASSVTPEITSRYGFISNLLSGSSLEGFLFPDTYYFYKDATGEEIFLKMLDNFDSKLTSDLQAAIKNQNKSIYDIVTMASIIEKESGNDQEDRKLISGIFWNRIEIGQALGSDATLSYVLDDDKISHSINETFLESPYNTYRNKGLPKGPICNPGMDAITAAIYPEQTDYNYFLSIPGTDQIIFSKNFAEHVANKAKYGL
jgi:UPF0755 protein